MTFQDIFPYLMFALVIGFLWKRLRDRERLVIFILYLNFVTTNLLHSILLPLTGNAELVAILVLIIMIASIIGAVYLLFIRKDKGDN